MNYSYTVHFGDNQEGYSYLEDAKSCVKSTVQYTHHNLAWIVDDTGNTVYTYRFDGTDFVESDYTGDKEMYTVKATRNGANVASIDEKHGSYYGAKTRAHNLVHSNCRHAVVTRPNGTIAYEISFDGNFHEQEYDTTMNTTPSSPTRNKIAEIKAVRAIHTDMGLKDAKDFVEARTTEQVAMYILENVYSHVNSMRDKLSGYDSVQASLDLYKKDYDSTLVALREKDSQIDTLQKENRNLLHQRNQLLALLTKEQLIDLLTASGSQTE